MNRSLSSVFLIWLTVFCLTAAAHEAENTTPYPGFRPECEHAESFLAALDTASIAVLPTIVRRSERTAHSFASQAQAHALLNEIGIGTAATKSRRVKMLPLQRVSQWDLFQYGLGTIATALEGYETDADYTLVMEILVPDNSEVFGIEVYVLDQQRRNAFSFLLNSHHQMFVDAKLRARNSSEAARTKMIEDATRVGIMALQQQIDIARESVPLG
jgi:hypothetical protein